MNKSYAKLINGQLNYAPSVLDTPGGIIMNPKRLSYLQAGWKFLDLQPPADPAPEGKEYAISGYTETATDIRPVFKLIALNSPLGTRLRSAWLATNASPADAAVIRTFSKLRLVAALTKRGIWAAFRDWLTETDLYDLFLAANDFREDHPQFAAALSAHPCVRRGLSLPYWSRRPTGGGYALSRFHLTPSETAAILAESAAP